MPNGQFGLNAQKIHTNTQQDFMVSESESKILKIIEETDPEQLAKKFNPVKKSIRTVDFYNRYYDDEIHLKVRAYVEKRLLKILDLLDDEPLFLAKDKNFKVDFRTEFDPGISLRDALSPHSDAVIYNDRIT